MSEQKAREVIAQALDSAGTVRAFRARRQGFLAGEDVDLADLDIDSLAAMELCIAIELNAGISIVPEELMQFTSLNEVVAALTQAAA